MFDFLWLFIVLIGFYNSLAYKCLTISHQLSPLITLFFAFALLYNHYQVNFCKCISLTPELGIGLSIISLK